MASQKKFGAPECIRVSNDRIKRIEKNIDSEPELAPRKIRKLRTTTTRGLIRVSERVVRRPRVK